MKRTTIVLTDELAILLERERRRRGVPATVVVREALDGYFGRHAEPLTIAGLGQSGREQTAEDAETIFAREWSYARLMGVADRDPDSDDREEEGERATPDSSLSHEHTSAP